MTDPEIELAQRIVTLMILSAWADGRVDGAEAVVIHRHVMASTLLRKAGNEADLSRRARARLGEVGVIEALREAAQGVRERQHRELAVRCCARVIGADGKLSAEEARVLATLRESFQLSREELQRLLQPSSVI